MLIASLVKHTEELKQILDLQQQNLKKFVSEEDRITQGFLTLEHSFPVLEAMHQLAPSVIIKDKDKVIAYALTELRECRKLMPGLEPMFALLDTLHWNGRPINDQRFYTMGQICVHRDYRGKGLFKQLYDFHKLSYHTRFDLFITEISTSNPRSLIAHEKAGFTCIHTHRDELDEWALVLWDWNK